MPLFVADYRSKTSHLSAAQHGAYLLLIMHYWETGGLPSDDGALARVASMSPSEWKKNRAARQLRIAAASGRRSTTSPSSANAPRSAIPMECRTPSADTPLD